MDDKDSDKEKRIREARLKFYGIATPSAASEEEQPRGEQLLMNGHEDSHNGQEGSHTSTTMPINGIADQSDAPLETVSVASPLTVASTDPGQFFRNMISQFFASPTPTSPGTCFSFI